MRTARFRHGRSTSLGLAIDQDDHRHERTAEDLGRFAHHIDVAAEAIAALWVSDNPGGNRKGLDPFCAVAAMATTTQRLWFGTGVAIAPFYGPLALARHGLALDQLSSGRFVLGLGAGSSVARAAGGFRPGPWGREYDALVRAVITLTAGEQVTSSGNSWQLEAAEPGLGPHSEGPPILLSGAAAAALRRSAQLADGWVGSSRSPNLRLLAGEIESLRTELAAHGRTADDFFVVKRVVVRLAPDMPDVEPPGGHTALVGEPDDLISALLKIAEVGVDHLIIDPLTHDRAALDRLISAVITPVARVLSTDHPKPVSANAARAATTHNAAALQGTQR